MIYFLYGDQNKARKKMHALVESMQKKQADATLIKVNSETWRSDILQELLATQGLFYNKLIIEMDQLLKNKEAKEALIENLKEIQTSQNVFIFLEETIDKTTLAKFEKKAEKIQEFEMSEPREKEGDFKIFSLTDALGRRDKKQLWILFNQAKRAGVSDEEIHGILFWQIKSMLLAAKSRDASAAGLNPFVYTKSKSFLNNFEKGEVEKISSRLVTLYHESRRGKHELASALERFVLTI